ncbi:MAK10-like protein [Tanacetum coccineum]
MFQPNGPIPNRSFNNRPKNFNNQSNIEGLVSDFMASQDARLSKFETDFKRQQGEMTNKIDTVLKAITDPTRDELTYHKYHMCGPTPSIFLQNPIIIEGCPSNLKIPCNIRHVHVEKAYIDLKSPLNIMTQMMYNWIMRRKLNPSENLIGGISNFTGRIKGMHVFVGNFTYVVNFMIVEDIRSIIDFRLSRVVLGRPFIEISNMTHDPPEGVVRLYLMRRSLEVLRKFHWMILEGRFNQSSHVSSPLLSKPGEYYFAFRMHLEEIQVTWAHLEKKRIRIQTYTSIAPEFLYSGWRRPSNWLERLPAGSITTWEDLTTRFLAQFFSPGRTAKLRNDILMFQQHHEESLSEAWTNFKDLLQKVTHYGIDLWLQVQIFYDDVNPVTRRTIDQSAGGKLHDHNSKESWVLLEDFALYDNKSWNDLRDFAKSVKEIALPQDVPSTSDRRLIELENQVQRLMEAHLASTQATQLNLRHHNPPQANEPDVGQEVKGNLGNINSNPHPQPDPLASITIEQVQKLNSMLESLGFVPQSSNTKFVCSKEDNGEVMFMKIIRDDDEPQNEGPNKGEGAATEGPAVEYFDIFPTRDELTYHKYLMCGLIPSIFLRNPIIIEGCLSNLKIPCNIGHVHVEKSYIDLNSPLNIMTRMMYNWIMRRKLDPKENPTGGISNFIGRIKGMHVFVGNFTYVVDFMIFKDISSIIDPRFTYENDEVAYKIPHKIEQYNSLSNLEKEHTKSVYLRNEDDKRRGVEYVMSRILGFYKECLELGTEYVIGIDDEGEVTLWAHQASAAPL